MQNVDMEVKGRKLRKSDMEGKQRKRREMENQGGRVGGGDKKEETRKREKVEVVGWDGMISHIEVEFISYNMHIMSTLLVNA